MDTERLQQWGWARQGLDGSLRGRSAAEVLARTGWMRSVGGAGPYLGLGARAGLGRAAVDAAVAALEIHELPSARGCTYVLPAAHFALGLQAGQGFGDEAAINTARKYLGVTETELQALHEAVQAALSAGPLDPADLKKRLGDKVRNLGAEGKKRGQTSTLPLSLGWLQSHGRIRRVSLNGRLDQQRYAYALWAPSPLDGPTLTGEALHTALARLFFGWAGPATLAQFQTWSGLGVKASKAAVAPLGLLELQGSEGRFLSPEDHEAWHQLSLSTEPRYAFLSNLDGLFLHRREVAPLLSPADAGRPLWTEKGLVAGNALMELSNQAIVDRGRIIGLWDFDPMQRGLVWTSFSPPDEALRAEATRFEAWIREDLGDVRTFSLDSPESRQERIRALLSV